MKLLFRITFETSVEIPDEELEQRGMTRYSAEEFADWVNGEYDSDLVEDYVPPFDPDSWSCVDHQWEGAS